MDKLLRVKSLLLGYLGIFKSARFLSFYRFTRLDRIEFGALAVFFISVFFVVIYMLGWLRDGENLIVDGIVVLSSENRSSGDHIVYAHTSQRGLKESEKEYNMGWPWRRAAYSKLIDFFNLSGARLIVFDSIFSESSVYSYLGEDDDEFFADTVSGAKNVIMGMVFYLKEHELDKKIEDKLLSLRSKPISELKGLLKRRLSRLKALGLLASESELYSMNEEELFVFLRAYFEKTLLMKYDKERNKFLEDYAFEVEERGGANSIVSYYRTVPPIKLLWDKALQLSSVEGPLDEDGKARRTPLLIKYWGKYYPSLSFASIYHYLKPSKVVVEEDKILLDDREIPLTKGGYIRLKFYGTRHIYPTFYHIDIMRVYDYIEDLHRYYVKSLGRSDITREDIYNDYSNIFKIREEVAKKSPRLADKVDVGLLERLDPSSFRGKVVVLGSIAPGMFDQRATPFSQVESGVHIHATAIDNILNDDVLMEVREEWYLGLFIFVLPWVVYFLSSRVSLGYGSIIIIFLMVFVVLLGVFLYMEVNVLMDIGTILLVLLFTFPVMSIIKYFKESKQKKYIKGVFSQYLSPKVIDIIINDPDKLELGGTDKEITAFFSDIEGFSTISEGLEASRLVHLLNDYLTEMCDIIVEYDGVVDKFEGDAVIAFWGAPLEQPDHAQRAVMATIKMQDRMEELRKSWAKIGAPVFKMRVGLNSGPAVVGNMGSKQRMDYTMIGDTVNTAARLESANKFYSTYTMISEYTYGLVKDIAEVREIDRVRVMGKDKALSIYELLSLKGGLDSNLGKLIESYREGYRYYAGREFEKAKACFISALGIDSGDFLSKLYLSKCEEFIKEPPLLDWDGITNLDKK